MFMVGARLGPCRLPTQSGLLTLLYMEPQVNNASTHQRINASTHGSTSITLITTHRHDYCEPGVLEHLGYRGATNRSRPRIRTMDFAHGSPW